MEYPVLIRIQQRIADLGLTEANAATRSNLSDSAIRNIRRAWEAGKDTKFSSRTLEALAPTLQTTVAWLLDGAGPKEASDSTELLTIFVDLPLADRQHVLDLARRLRDGSPKEPGTE